MPGKLKGFTLIELIVVMIVVGILSVTILPRFANRSDFDQAGYRDQVVSVLQFARKTAVAQRRRVCVVVDATGVSVTTDRNAPESALGACSDPLPLPGGNGSCGTNRVCAPGQVALGAATFNFDALGRASAAASITITGGSNIVVEQETGYVH